MTDTQDEIVLIVTAEDIFFDKPDNWGFTVTETIEKITGNEEALLIEEINFTAILILKSTSVDAQTEYDVPIRFIRDRLVKSYSVVGDAEIDSAIDESRGEEDSEDASTEPEKGAIDIDIDPDDPLSPYYITEINDGANHGSQVRKQDKIDKDLSDLVEDRDTGGYVDKNGEYYDYKQPQDPSNGTQNDTQTDFFD